MSSEYQFEVTNSENFDRIFVQLRDSRDNVYDLPLSDENTYKLPFDVVDDCEYKLTVIGVSNSDEFVQETINVEEAGTLATLLGTKANQVRSLKITGQINANDFYFLRDNTILLSNIDLSEAIIVKHGTCPDNTMPEEAFLNKRLDSIILPETLVNIRESALQGTYLQRITLPKSLNKINELCFFTHAEEVIIVSKNPVPPASAHMSNRICEFNEKAILIVPEGSLSAYSAAKHWQDIGTILEGDDIVDMQEVVVDGIIYKAINGIANIIGVTGDEEEEVIIPSHISLPDGSLAEVQFISKLGLYSYKIRHIHFPYTLKNVAILGIACDMLQKISVEENNPTFSDDDGVLYDDVTKKLVCYPNRRFELINSREYAVKDGTEILGSNCFRYSLEIDTITLPASLKIMEEHALLLPNIVVCYAEVPPVMHYHNIEGKVLYVPYGKKEAYENAYGWNSFEQIIEMEPAGIETIPIDETSVEIFTIDGRKVKKVQTGGTYIVRTTDGKARTVILK